MAGRTLIKRFWAAIQSGLTIMSLLALAGLGVFWHDLAHSAVWCRLLIGIALVLLVWYVIRQWKSIWEFLKKEEKAGGVFQLVHMEGQSRISDSDIRATFNSGGAFSPVAPEPLQLAISDWERAAIGEELRQIGETIQNFIPTWITPASEFMARAGSNDPKVWHTLRVTDEMETQEHYRRDIRPRVIDVYSRARVRGYYHPLVEEMQGVVNVYASGELAAALLVLSRRYS
jgi:hypothetical protein